MASNASNESPTANLPGGTPFATTLANPLPPATNANKTNEVAAPHYRQPATFRRMPDLFSAMSEVEHPVEANAGNQAQIAAPAYVQGVAYMPFAPLAAKHILYLTPNGQSTTLSWGAMKAIDESPETQIEHYIVEIKEPNGRWMATGLVLSTEAAEGEAYTFEVDDCQSSSAYRVKGCMASGVIIVTETLR
jgi:hypothetical protein